MSLSSWIRRFLGTKSVGERVWARLLSGFGAFGLPGSWASDRKEQVLHWRGWPYVVGKTIAEEIAALIPQVGCVRQPTEYEERLGKALKSCHPSRRKQMEAAFRRKYLTGLRRRKSLAAIQPHEELELCESNHRLVRLLRNPNGWDTGWQFWYRTIMNLELTGSSYWWVIPDAMGLPLEMWVVPSQWVWPSPVRYADDIISWYEIRPYGTPGGAGVFKIPAEEMIPIQYPHPLTLWDGFSPLQAMAPWIDVMESMDTCQWAAFKNQIGADAYVKLDPKVQDPNEESIKRLIGRLENRQRGEGNWRRPAVLSPGAELVYPKGTTPSEMDFVASGNTKRDWILSGWGVSKFMVGIQDDSNRAVALAAISNFIRKVIRPRLLLIDSVATERLAHRIDDNMVVFHDDPTPDDPEELRQQYQLGKELRAVTPNEYRVNVLGLEAWEHGGDDPIGAATDVPLPYGTGEDADAAALAEAMAQIQEAKAPPPAPAMNGQTPANRLGTVIGRPPGTELDGLPAEKARRNGRH